MHYLHGHRTDVKGFYYLLVNDEPLGLGSHFAYVIQRIKEKINSMTFSE